MQTQYVILTILIIVLIFYCYHDTVFFGPYNTRLITVQNERYQVHRAHNDSKKAAVLMDKISKNNEKLFSHLREKYMASRPSVQLDPAKNNRIDIIPGTEMYHIAPGI